MPVPRPGAKWGRESKKGERKRKGGPGQGEKLSIPFKPESGPAKTQGALPCAEERRFQLAGMETDREAEQGGQAQSSCGEPSGRMVTYVSRGKRRARRIGGGAKGVEGETE